MSKVSETFQGFYGEVYKATMETTTGQDDELKMVAVKKLKTNATDLTAKDFEQEINIMKVSCLSFDLNMLHIFTHICFRI